VTIAIRPVRLPGDEAGIAAIDASFETDAVYEIEQEPRAFRIVKTPIPQRTKRFWVYDLRNPDRDWDEAHVAVDGERIVGFVCTSWQFWNRRVVLWHIYVDRAYRGQGLGHRLLDQVYARANRQQALAIFLETSNLNVPGVAWYERQGFRLGGLDTTLYNGTEAAEEMALYLVKTL
jgi:ribosomal protein S18 acetylase RimI-like enzyme